MSIAENIQGRFEGLYPGLLQIEILEASTEGITAKLEGRDELCTIPGLIHGGALMSLADTLGAVATMLNLPEGATGTTTIESKTNFLAAVTVDGGATAECKPIHRGKQTMVWQTEIRNAKGKLAALVTQTQMVLRAK
jgi:1,4-dihydroxy-2-naphthoyl-CoA hydrolase